MWTSRAFTLAVTLALGTAIVARPAPAFADGKTWCVGGLKFASSNQDDTSVGAHGCEAEQKNRSLPSWHWHNNWFVTKNGTDCFTCWDMTDDTCNSEGVQKKGWRVITAKECRDMGPASLSNKTFIDPDNRWNPAADPIALVPLDDVVPVKRRPPPPPDTTYTPPVTQPPPDTTFTPPVDAAVATPPPETGFKPPVTNPPPVTTTPPPIRPNVPKATPVSIQIGVRVSPGPYAMNDPVTMTGFASTAAGPRGVSGGWFQWATPDGKAVLGPDQQPLRVRATPGPKGTVTATAPAPQAGALKVQYVPDGIELRASESLAGKPPPGEVAISVSQCRLRGVVLSPAQHELIATTKAAKVVLKGRFETASGQASTQLGGASPVFSVELVGKEQRIPARDVGGELVGELDVLPPETDTDELSVRLFGDGGGNDVCPGPTVKARLTKLGVALEVTATKACYVGRPCPVEVKFRLPLDPLGRPPAVQFASAPDLMMTLAENGTPTATLTPGSPGNPDSSYAGTFKPVSAGEIELAATARSASQGREVRETLRIVVREPIELKLPTALDLGTVTAGASWPAGCAKLDFSTSRGVLEQVFQMRSTLPAGCTSRPALQVKGLGVPLPAGLEVEMQYDSTVLSICVAEVPRCAGETGEVVLTIVPKNPDFADQKTDVKLTWKVLGRSFLACHWWWIAAGVGGVLLLLIGYGFVKPYDFSAHDAVKLAADRQKLVRAVGRRLRDLPGGRAGWYRNAATGLREDGSATNKLSQAAVVLEARKGDVVLKGRSGLQRVNPQSKKLEPLETGKHGVAASKGVTYVSGDLHFSID